MHDYLRVMNAPLNEYWTNRNALVDAVHAARVGAPDDLTAFSLWCRSNAGVGYYAALDALKAFDTAHGCAPIL